MTNSLFVQEKIETLKIKIVFLFNEQRGTLWISCVSHVFLISLRQKKSVRNEIIKRRIFIFTYFGTGLPSKKTEK